MRTKKGRKIRGLTIVYTGDGKGKTTAALGLALRAVGWGKRVLIIQFLKKHDTGEKRVIKKLEKHPKARSCGIGKWKMKIEQYGTEDFVSPKKLRTIDFREARKGFKKATEEIKSGNWDLIILDEINVAVKFGLIKMEKLLEFIKNKPRVLDLVLTGRFADKKIIDAADLVTEFVEVKHPYEKRMEARRGIDY